jgi:hypothetical protein
LRRFSERGDSMTEAEGQTPLEVFKRRSVGLSPSVSATSTSFFTMTPY